MKSVRDKAYAKLNYTLDVLNKREDGYHEISSVMQSIELADIVTVSIEEGEAGIKITADREDVPTDSSNTAYRAVEAFWQEVEDITPCRVSIDIQKNIPSQAGLGGSSADAAFVISALDYLYGTEMFLGDLASIGAKVGADVPFCIIGGTMLAEGIGEELSSLPAIPQSRILICKPDFSVSTPELYQIIDTVNIQKRPDFESMRSAIDNQDLEMIGRNLCNVFEEALPEEEFKRIEKIKQTMLQGGALGASMTGSGSAVFGIFTDQDAESRAAEMLRGQGAELISTRTYDPYY